MRRPVAATRALFVISMLQFSREALPVIERFEAEGIDVQVLVGWSGESADEFAAVCASRGAGVHRLPEHIGYGDTRAARIAGAADRRPRPVPLAGVRRRLGLAVGPLLSCGSLLGRFRRTKALARALADEIRPDVILGGPYQSPWFRFDEAIARVANERGILYCCLPLRTYLGERYVVATRFSESERARLPASLDADAGLPNRLLARLFPAWTRQQGGTTLFLFPPATMVAARLSGLLAENPWQQPSELYDFAFVESDYSRQLLVESGYEPGKIVVSGRPVLDTVLAGLASPGHGQGLRRALGLGPDASFLLFNVEPSYEHGYVDRDEHWLRFRGLMQALQETRHDAVLSLHPLCDPADYRFVQDEYGFRLAEDFGIAELYPYCALAVSYPSSTNSLALLFDKPLVVYDFLGAAREGMSGSEYYRLGASEIVFELGELAAAIRRAESVAPAKPGASGTNRPAPAAETICREVLARLGR